MRLFMTFRCKWNLGDEFETLHKICFREKIKALLKAPKKYLAPIDTKNNIQYNDKSNNRK